MRISRSQMTIAFVLTIALAGISASASMTDAGAKCPNRFFKRVKVEGVGDTEANATTAYNMTWRRRSRLRSRIALIRSAKKAPPRSAASCIPRARSQSAWRKGRASNASDGFVRDASASNPMKM
jgi:predicted secreted Zn-dependent protease